MLCPPGAFSSQTSLCWASSNSSITIQIFLPHHWFPRHFPFVTLCFGQLWLYSLVCLSSPRRSGLPCVLPSFMDPRRVVDFSGYSAPSPPNYLCWQILWGKTTKCWAYFMWFTSLRDFCHLIPCYVGISSMPSITVYFALYLDFKIFLGRNVGLLQATLF